MARTDPDTVRSALNADISEYSDDDLAFDIESASDLIDKRVAPYTNEDLTMVETFVAAYYAVADPASDFSGQVTRERHLSAEVSYAAPDPDDPGFSYWSRAINHDPTGRLGKTAGSFKAL